jgi:hypothetical protein
VSATANGIEANGSLHQHIDIDVYYNFNHNASPAYNVVVKEEEKKLKVPYDKYLYVRPGCSNTLD